MSAPQILIDQRVHWGQARPMRVAEWVVNRAVPVLSWNGGVQADQKVVLAPTVKTFTLGVDWGDIDYETASNFIQGMLRWVVDAGAGGARARYKLDAESVQQIALVADTWTISIVAEAPRYFDNSLLTTLTPQLPITANAFVGEGNSGGMAATYTEPFYIASGEEAEMALPFGARAFRLTGGSSIATAPFLANVGVKMSCGPTSVFYTGADLEDVSRAGFVPIPGTSSMRGVRVENESANDISGAIQYQLDL